MVGLAGGDESQRRGDGNRREPGSFVRLSPGKAAFLWVALSSSREKVAVRGGVEMSSGVTTKMKLTE